MNLLRGVSHHFNASRTKMMKFMSKNKLLFIKYDEVTYNTIFTEGSHRSSVRLDAETFLSRNIALIAC